MKRIFALLFVALVSLPGAGFACGDGDCSMDLPPPPVPVPGPLDHVMGALSQHAGLFAGLAIAALFGGLIASRQRKLLTTKAVGSSLAPTS